MQANVKRSVFSRLISCVLAVLMFVGLMPAQTLSAMAAESDSGDFKLTLSWNKMDDNCKDPNDPSRFVYESDTEETRYVRLKVAYSNKKVSRAFKEGEIVINVPGLKGAVRSGDYYKPEVAADEAGTPNGEREYEWSYSYTAANDMYTFTYNKDIQPNSTFEGSFELVWKLPSRETVHDFDTALKAELFTSDVNVESNTLTYSQTRERDVYEVGETAKWLYNETLPLENREDYIWVSYDINGKDMYKARDVDGAETFELYFLEGEQEKTQAFYLNGRIEDTGIKVVDGKKYRTWTLTRDINDKTEAIYFRDIMVAYPRSEFQKSPYYGDPGNNDPFRSIVKIIGKYFEETKEVTLAEANCDIDLQLYDFSDVPGPIYDVEKNSYGIHMDSIDAHDQYCQHHGAINSLHLSDGKGNYRSTFNLDLYYTVDGVAVGDDGSLETTTYVPADSYRLEFVDDIIDVQLKDGSIRQLRDDEYSFTQVDIPSNRTIKNANGYPVKADKYNYEVYVRRAERGADGKLKKQCNNGVAADGSEPKNNGNFEAAPIASGLITKNAQTVDLPEDTVGVKIVIYDVTESFFIDENIGCRYKFHTDDEDIMTDGGQIINNMHFNLIGTKDGAVLEPNYMQFGPQHYAEGEGGTADSRQYQRDLEIYGHALDRERAVTHIIEIPNEFKLSGTSIERDVSVSANGNGYSKGAYYFKGSTISEFVLGEGTELSDFSIYTIIPKGLKLTKNADDPDSLLDAVQFYSSGGQSSAYIASHTKIEIIDDPDKYDGRQFVAFHFDFSDDPITTKNISISGIPMYVFRHDLTGGSVSFTMHAAMMVDQPGKWYTNGVDSNSMEDGVWVDIDSDGETKDLASFASGYVELANEEEFHMELTKFVQTPLTGGMVSPKPEEVRDADGFANAAAPKTYAGGEYSYFLYATVVAGTADHVVFADVIEPEGSSDWRGEFLGVDYSQVVSKLEYPEGVEKVPTIYYSNQEETFEKTVDGNTLMDRDSFTKGNWTTVKPDKVRSIAVDFGEGKISTGLHMALEIKMRAPENTRFCYKLATNSCSIGYNWQDKTSEDSANHPDYLTSNTVPVTYVPSGKIIMSKKDEVTNVNITGAKFELYREDVDGDTLIGEYETNGNGMITVDMLEYGTYYFVEKEAPVGYVKSDEKLYATVSQDVPTQRINFVNERKKGQYEVTKVSDRTGKLLKGAEFKLYNSDDTPANDTTYVTDENGKLTVSGLAWGKYYLKESKAPKGYELSEEKIEFEINAETVENPVGTLMKNEQKPAMATLVKHELAAGHEYDDVTAASEIGDEPIKGAIYQLYKANGEKVLTGVTDADGKIYAEDLAFGSYYFLEDIEAVGYRKYAEKIEFTVDADQTEAALVIRTADSRKTGNVWLQKLDDKKEYVKDAVYGLYDGEGNALTVTKQSNGMYKYIPGGSGATKEMVTSSEGIIEVEGLYWGDYYIKEIKAPTGYKIDEAEHRFTIDKKTVSATQLIYSTDPRIKGKAELTKIEQGNEDTTLADAVFTLYKTDGTIYRDDLTTGADGKFVVEDLEWGSYYFLEKKAPANYGLNDTKIRFSVNYLTAGKTQQFVAEDPPLTYKLDLSKIIDKSTAITAHGLPTFTFKIENTATHAVLYRTLAFSKDNLAGTGNAEVSVSVPLNAGTYEITEMDSDRYEIGKISVDGVEQAGTAATVTLSGEVTDAGVSVKFENTKNDQKGTSDNSAVNNMLRREKKVTAISAVYSGPTIVTDVAQIEDNLIVYVIYDDESKATLNKATAAGNDGYVLDPDPSAIDASMNGSTTIKVSYKPGARTYRDSFDITIDLPSPFTAQFVSGSNGVYSNLRSGEEPTSFIDSDGTKYDGKVKITGYIGTSSVINFPAVLTGYIATGNTTEDSRYVGKKFKVVGVEPKNPMTSSIDVANNRKNSITTVIFAEGIEYIGAEAFRSFGGLTSVEYSSSIISIGVDAFRGCTKLTDNELPANIPAINDYAFYDCRALTELKLPDNITRIGEHAFDNCFNAKGGLTIPASVTEIGDAAFYQCSGLKGDLVFEEGSKLKIIGNQAFFSKNGNGLSGNLVLPDTLEEIGYDAFRRCWYLTGDLNIPANVKTIGHDAFRECTRLTGKLTFSENSKLTAISDNAFWKVPFSGDLSIPEGVTSIGNEAFRSHDSVQSFVNGKLTLPSTLKTIGNYAFCECEFTGDLKIPKNVEIIGDWAFRSCGFKGTLTFENGSHLTEIKSCAFFGIPFSGDLNIPNGVTKIGDEAFQSYGITSFSGGNLTLPDSVEEIGAKAFYQCEFGGTLTLPRNPKFTVIQGGTFYDCNKLTGKLVIPSNIRTINNSAETYDKGAFDNCTGLEGLEFESGIETIGTYAFQKCSGLKGNLVIPDTVTEIRQGAFYLTGFDGNLTLSKNLITLGNSAFNSCEGFTGALTIPDKVESIGDSTFMNCKGFTGEVTLPRSLTSIQKNVFQWCGYNGNLTKIKVPNTIKDQATANGAFNDCKATIEYYD